MVSVPVHCPYCHSSEIITSVKMADARGGSFFCTTTIAVGCRRSAARWSTWRSTAAAYEIPPGCCGLAPRP